MSILQSHDYPFDTIDEMFGSRPDKDLINIPVDLPWCEHKVNEGEYIYLTVVEKEGRYSKWLGETRRNHIGSNLRFVHWSDLMIIYCGTRCFKIDSSIPRISTQKLFDKFNLGEYTGVSVRGGKISFVCRIQELLSPWMMRTVTAHFPNSDCSSLVVQREGWSAQDFEFMIPPGKRSDEIYNMACGVIMDKVLGVRSARQIEELDSIVEELKQYPNSSY